MVGKEDGGFGGVVVSEWLVNVKCGDSHISNMKKRIYENTLFLIIKAQMTDIMVF